MGGTPGMTTRNGQLVTAWMAYQIDRLAAAFWARFGLVLLVMSAIRTYQEQVDIFLSRYVTASQINGRKVYDTRVWNGTRYYRISPLGTVAVPGTSNHEIQGSNAAVDFGDSGRDAGVAVAGTERANWLKANAPDYDFIPEGYNFREPWHYLARNIFNQPPADTAPVVEHWKDADMRIINTTDGKAWLVGPGSTIHIKNPSELVLLQRTLLSNPADPDTFTPEEQVIIDGYMGDLVDQTRTNSLTFMHVIGSDKKTRTYMVAPGGQGVHVLNGDHLALLLRYVNSGPTRVDTFTQGQYNTIVGYLSKIGVSAAAS